MSLFHINSCSLPKNTEELKYLLDKAKIDSDVISISESRIKKDKSPINSINLKGYSHESCPTESAAGGTLLCISNNLSCKPRNDSCIYKSTELESTFNEILSPKKTNMIVGCIYRHPHMDLNEFNDYYINNLLDKLSKENKTVFLLGDFNIDLLNYDQHSLTNEFLDSLSSHMILPHILQPIRTRNNSKTLIDNIYSKVITPNNISGNITVTISDHLPNFFFVSDIFSNPPSIKLNTFERDWSKFDQKNFILDYLSVDWENLIKSNCGNVDQSFVSFLTKFNSILDLCSLLKKISKQKLKFRNKPWITLGLQKSISIKNHLLTKYIKLRDVTLKNEVQIKYNQYRNLLSTLIKESKRSYFTNCFENNLNDLKSTWKGIKNLISLKELPNVAPSNIFDNGRSLTEPQEVAADIQSSIRFSKNNFHDFLTIIFNCAIRCC